MSEQEPRELASRNMTIGVVVFIAGVLALLIAVFAPMGFGGRAPFGNVIAGLVGAGAVIFGISYIRNVVRFRRTQHELIPDEAGLSSVEAPSAAAAPELWDAEGLPRTPPPKGPQPPLPQPWRHTGV